MLVLTTGISWMFRLPTPDIKLEKLGKPLGPMAKLPQRLTQLTLTHITLRGTRVRWRPVIILLKLVRAPQLQWSRLKLKVNPGGTQSWLTTVWNRPIIL